MQCKYITTVLLLLITICSDVSADTAPVKRGAGLVAVDNFGQQSTGEWRERIQYHLYDLASKGDDLMLGFARSQQDSPNGGKIRYSLPLNEHGALLIGECAQAGLDASGASPAQSFEKGITYSRCSAMIPITQTSRYKTWSVIGLSQVHAKRVWQQNGFSSHSDVSLLEISVNRSVKAAQSQTNVSLSFAGNFHRNPTGFVNNAQPGRFDLDIKHNIQFTPKWQVMFRGLGVFTRDPLLDSQKFVLGGYSSVRGFAASEVNGDGGFLLSAESFHKLGSASKFYYYTDYGYTRAKSPAVSNTLSGAGFGVSNTFSSGSTVSLDWAFPLNDHIVKDGRQDGRLWMSFSTPIGIQ
ncbi:MAG: ShlB/FhaC/HecB family hemolysin secretion/activation protein [Armatimonadota bacterium]|nr:BamA/TamA family outer membrane protein [bacterium]